jgi:hypothetical protein
MTFWEKIRKDVEKGVKDIEKGLKDGLTVIKKEAGVLAEGGKKKYKVFELKSNVQRQMADLGGLVYSMSGKDKDPLKDSRVKAAITKIKKTETQINKLGGAKKKAAKKKGVKKKAAAKKKSAAKAK